MSSPAITAVVLTLALGVGTGAAYADADEASVHVQLVGGAARTVEELPTARNPTEPVSLAASAPLAGLAGRVTYATSNLFAYDAQVVFAQAGAAGYDDVMVETPQGMRPGDVTRVTRFARLEGGVTLRLGVRFIPTLHLGVGAQARQRADLELDGARVAAGELAVDLTATGSVGFDYRINRRWIAGIQVGATHAFPLGAPAFDAIEGSAHVSYYFYPRW